jgi:hypothetical protein
MEQTISTAAKTSVLALVPQVRNGFLRVLLNRFMRVIVVASCRRAALLEMHEAGQCAGN